jgi:hypothetical protein
VRVWGDSDFLNGRADALHDLALVLRSAGERSAVGEAAAEAVALYRAKGNVVSSAHASRLLDSNFDDDPEPVTVDK